MSRIGIDSPDLGFRVLCYLIELAESGELDPLIQAGFSAETLSALRQMPVSEINRMAGMLGLFDLGVNVPRITAALAARMGLRADSEDLTYLAKAGATAVMLAECFRITIRDAEAHLRTLTPSRRSGRPSMPDGGTRDAIHQWWAVQQSLPPRQRWIALHQHWPNYSLASLYAVINEFNL